MLGLKIPSQFRQVDQPMLYILILAAFRILPLDGYLIGYVRCLADRGANRVTSVDELPVIIDVLTEIIK